MARRSPLLQAQPNAVSVCGKVIQAGQTITVASSAIGDRERKLAAAKKISLRDSNTKGFVQITCTLKD